MSVAIAVCKGMKGTMGGGEDSRLVARCRQGDRDAQEALVRRYQDKVYRLAYNLLGDAEEALDACQEALIAMLHSLPGFRGEAQFSTWLYRLTTNICLMQRRRAASRARLPLDPDFRSASLPDPIAAAQTGELQGIVRQHLRNLPAEYRGVLVLRELEELSYEEIASVLHIPVGTVQSRLSRGRELLRKSLLKDKRICPAGGGR
jgi:RNA polymerase sigma-70 factor, ECF subfamily